MTLPPCGHGNGTHPSDCWWPAAMEMAAEARAPLEEEIAALRDALDGLVEAAERVLAYGRVRPFADAARDQLRSALAAVKEKE